MRRDYYAVLGVAATAPPREIRQAYRRLARQYSPDVNFWDTTARTLFEEIAEAYRILSDPDARSGYDRFGARPHALAAARRRDALPVAGEGGCAPAAPGVRRPRPGGGSGGRPPLRPARCSGAAARACAVRATTCREISSSRCGWTSPAASTRAPTSSCAGWSGSCRPPRGVT